MHRSVHILRPGKARTRRKKRRGARYSAIRAKKPAEAGFPHHPPGYPRKMTVFWASRPPAVDKPGGKQKLSTVPARRLSTDICDLFVTNMLTHHGPVSGISPIAVIYLSV